MTEETRDPQRHTGFLLRLAQQHHVATWQKVVTGDTTNVQYGVLSVLARVPGASQKEICEELELDRSTVADVCLRMQNSGLISRVPDSKDKRRNVLHLTASGKLEFARLQPLIEQVQLEMTSNLTEEEHQTLRNLLKKLLPLK